MKERRKGRATNTPRSNRPQPLQKGPVDVIVQDCSARLYGQSETKRGGTGPASKLNPDPHMTHGPQEELQGVRV
jgi:hypothetical protein